ncbi:flagellar assembly peptidoglycan hydrolase FlgJ [Bordetella pertussis]|uniref:Peptidoglycan hydrolase FlgJ n=56 Tax=Bordetella pertussis TaxID=520 RepID=A0A0T7CQ69_BORP1|nr:flagellar assembly peptidoglycan hydrolase FlgJ [Bordetella pertussis]AZR85248.1 flagellar rod assembly protein/muramidase FlgJ [Bordetella pertussis]PNO98097.1 flagellar assembly peptidoglycan hydrolase FlgJ [Bordetella pertussis 18323]UEB58409.1 flagellar assembly peptidoglycan hydrolase FlgJ [Bordetella pertussis]CCJ63657.1 peptidoglycan hydrolase [Bordetella pertussis 18323]
MSFVSYTSRPGVQESVFDLGRLADLKRDAVKAPDGQRQQTEVARQFEALFLQMMLKRMREATPKEGLFDSQQTEMLQGMADEQLALQLASPGIGLAQALLGQMQQGQPPVPAAAAAGGDAAAARALAGTAAPAPLVRDLRGNYVQPDPAPRREVNALLDVLRSNRARDRAMAAAEGAPSHVVDFVSRMSRAANVAAQQSGVPARLILGQAALESGWGRRELRHEDGSTSYNLFGIKAGASWKGKVVNVMTTEYVDGVAQKLVQSFRAYSSYEESFSDYARLIGNSPRYEAAVTQAGNEIEAARRIQEAGYATDPRYAEKLISIMGQLRTSVARADFSGGL